MAMTERSMVVGVFKDHALAEEAINELKDTGFNQDQIRLVQHRSSGGILDTLKGIFTGHETHETSTASGVSNNDLSDLPERDIPFYQHELDVGSALVMVQAQARKPEAEAILYRHGAYNATASQLTDTRTMPVRQEELQANKRVVHVGDVIIRKRVITEQRTFTIPVLREEITIERISFTDQSNQLQAEKQSDADGSFHSNQPTYAINPTNRPIDQEDTLILNSNAAMHANQLYPTTNQTGQPSPATANPANESEQMRTLTPEQEETLRQGGTVRIPVREERVSFIKQPVIVEEILIRRQRTQENRQISDNVRREEVRVERSGDVRIQGDTI